MFDHGVRWEFGPRPPIDDEEAATHTTPLLQAEASDRTRALASDSQDETGRGLRAMHISYDEPAADSTSSTTQPHRVSVVDVDLPNISTLLLSRNNPYQRSVFHSFKESKLHQDWLLSNTAVSQPDDNTLKMPMLPLLEPIRDDLLRLQALTPKSLPPYNPRLRTQRYAQILKNRLIPIGRYIVKILEQIPEDKRGNFELCMCRHIATGYWPLPTDEYTHLKIHEMYRNALFMSAQQPTTSQSPEKKIDVPLEQHSTQIISNTVPKDDSSFETWVGDLLEQCLALPISTTVPKDDSQSEERTDSLFEQEQNMAHPTSIIAPTSVSQSEEQIDSPLEQEQDSAHPTSITAPTSGSLDQETTKPFPGYHE
ncbi:hypothetical protein GMOD_00009525 [Pyrenophora seminiperda CCB06]|uniref:Chromodomain-helicase-DNA-binding protein 1-like C-terminal domain-containing protein n=1 Tax=Pyrenophora seminiperda CCB06 TaxID=1302712 RepID=A0A3M7MEZ9_9PLEO|nr:hypothetical protein GMOD_00009525 [Pyrenophora seminiperda CCB06]